tara:strand:+ start:587 stop:766 length:180 start_codon:yes stop_codon:yes gene_type:complete
LRVVHDLYAYEEVWLCHPCLSARDPEWAQSVKDMEAFLRVYDAEKKKKDQKKRNAKIVL